MRSAALLLVALLVIPGKLPAQRLTGFGPVAGPSLAPGLSQEPLVFAAPSRGRMTAGSMLWSSVGALVGWTAGALIVIATAGDTRDWDEAFAAAALAALAGSAGSVVLGGVGSRIGVRAAGGDGGPLGKHILASLVGWGASVAVLNVLYANNNSSGDDPNAGAAFTLLIGTHGVVTGLLAPKR